MCSSSEHPPTHASVFLLDAQDMHPRSSVSALLFRKSSAEGRLPQDRRRHSGRFSSLALPPPGQLLLYLKICVIRQHALFVRGT